MLSEIPCFFNDTATTEIYTLSLHDALPICPRLAAAQPEPTAPRLPPHRPGRRTLNPNRAHQHDVNGIPHRQEVRDRKSTRLNSSHANISYAVFCLKKKR